MVETADCNKCFSKNIGLVLCCLYKIVMNSGVVNLSGSLSQFFPDFWATMHLTFLRNTIKYCVFLVRSLDIF